MNVVTSCPVCLEHGEAECNRRRIAFANEPRLPNGFELGAQWTSPDGGLTWERFPDPRTSHVAMELRPSMTVTEIDVETGAVTVQVTR